MSDLRAVLVDDEQLAREELCYLLGQIGGVEVIGQADNGPAAVDTIDRLQPDVVFLDVQMPGLTGFEVARRVADLDAGAQIVFVTAYDQRAIEAFEVNAVDYLLKPVDPSRLDTALQRARRRIAANRQPGTDASAAGTGLAPNQLEKIVQLVSERQSRRERLAIKVGDRLLLVQAEEIIYASLVDETITIVTSQYVGHVELPDARRAADTARRERVLARAPIAPGEHQQDQGDRPVVQSELHPENEGREDNGDSGQSHANQASQGVSEDLTPASVSAASAFQADPPIASLVPSADSTTAEAVSVSQSLVELRDAPQADTPDDLVIALPPRHAGSRLQQLQEELIAWVKTLFSAAVYAILIVTFGFQVARVEGLSMAHTLEDQDCLIVNKLVYRISEPRRGDIVMLYYPLNPDKSFVKRVIAEEGDSVRIVDGRVYVNDIPLQDDYVSAEYRSHDDWGPQIIPEGYYFVMGDHRNNSSDSRHWGMVPKKYIIGKVQLRWWPVPTARVF
ncbi:MAG: signal peptidase I [Vicinamibacterales bacterium]